MTDLFLIAHKVRGEAAFDIACKQVCTICNGLGDASTQGCDECDGEGFWWIISSFGHRARPFHSWPLGQLCIIDPREWPMDTVKRYDPTFIAEQPDLFAINNQSYTPPLEVKEKAKGLLAKLGLARPKVTVTRRI